jgi:hypothetical protein
MIIGFAFQTSIRDSETQSFISLGRSGRKTQTGCQHRIAQPAYLTMVCARQGRMSSNWWRAGQRLRSSLLRNSVREGDQMAEKDL